MSDDDSQLAQRRRKGRERTCVYACPYTGEPTIAPYDIQDIWILPCQYMEIEKRGYYMDILYYMAMEDRQASAGEVGVKA